MGSPLIKCPWCGKHTHRWVDVTRTLVSDPSVSNRLTVCDRCLNDSWRSRNWTWAVHSSSSTAQLGVTDHGWY